MNATKAPEERPLRADARRNRERIIAAARKLFSGQRPDVQMDEIAERAEVGVGTLYRHFPDKEALMGELVRQRFELFNEDLRRALADERSGAFATLAAAMRANVASLAKDAATRFAFKSGGDRVVAHAAAEKAEYMSLADALIERAKLAGELRSDFESDEIPMLMCGICATIDLTNSEHEGQRHLDLVLRGMHV